ncbi:hypothetical protein SeMB42_g06083 [Synchytrium endobioticum]|uniref:acetyl-CoA C-acetyltransferase n=1 Tax=Synchytrium endobioticum TaxID=286115 RepID=A0A507CMA4_9FUNG|nr:hypothetical protein SeMB42_g06083 [Synchytrium endobioticum]
MHSATIFNRILRKSTLFRSRSIKTCAATYSTHSLNDVVIVSAVRTPIGSFQKSLSSLTSIDLGAIAVRAALKAIPPSSIQDVVFGTVLSANAGQAPARQIALRAGLDTHAEATTVNKVCASGLKAVCIAHMQMALGHRHACVAGGTESMSNTPYYAPRAATYGHAALVDGILRDGLLDPMEGIHMGVCAEHTAATHGLPRAVQDEHARESYRRAADAWKAGAFADEVVPVTVQGRKGDTVVAEDEEFKNMDAAKIASLRSAFQKNGTVTAANSSKISDGASAVVLMTEQKAKEMGVRPLARIVSFADAATTPREFTVAPSLAIPIALQRAGLGTADVALWEINEAFSVVVRANEKILGLDPHKVNVRGGAVALGHPIGSSGCRILVTLVHALKSGQFGCAAICNGGGAATAMNTCHKRTNMR